MALIFIVICIKLIPVKIKHMKRNLLNILLFHLALILTIGCAPSVTENESNSFQPPVAEKIEQKLEANGDVRLDNYYWMKLTDEQKNAEAPDEQTQKVVKYLEDENEYTAAVLNGTEEFQKKLFDEIVSRIKQTDESVPYFENGYWYYTRYEEGKEYPIYCRKVETMDNSEEIMLNVNEMAEGYAYYAVGGRSVSTDNNLLAYAVDTVSRRQYTVYFKNLETGEIADLYIPNTTGGVTWANDNETVFYTKKDPITLRSDKIFRHEVGTNAANDAEIYYEGDDTFYTGVYKTKSDKYIIIWSGSTLTNEYRIIDANNPAKPFRVFSPRERGLEYNIDHYKNKFYIVTNLDALNFRLMETPENATSKENWKEMIPHRADVLLQGVEVYNDYMVISERSKGLTQLRIINQNDKSEHYLDFGEQAYTAYVSTNPEFDSKILRFGYTSLTTPNSTYDYNMETREKILMKQEEVLGGFDPGNYVTERIWATARDGVKVPISLVYRKGFVKDGNAPMQLYGYGSYGATIDPSFSSIRLSLLDRGFVYAIAHIRGGQMLGRQWYEDGKMFKKKNTFTDFIDCAKFLIEENYTGTEKLFAYGGSAGGLLMGAVANMSPETFKGIIAAVPFVDVMSTMLDESIPLTTGEYDEWGNPNELESYQYMKSYSPYDQVEAKYYPNMLVTTGYWDSQVQYWEPAKWVAKLRDLKTDENKLLLYTNMDVGHGGASGRFERYKLTALQYAFMFDILGITE